MKKAIFKNGVLTERDMTPEEIKAVSDRADLVLANAPYERLSEIDAELSNKLARMIEDIAKGNAFDTSVQELLNEKEAIRASLTKETN